MNPPNPSTINPNTLIATLLALFIVIMSTVGFMRHRQQQQQPNSSTSVANKRKSMELNNDPDADSSFEEVVKRAYYYDAEPYDEESCSSGSSSAKVGAVQSCMSSTVGPTSPLEISGVAPLESTEMETSLDQEIDDFLESAVTLGESESTLKPSAALEDAIGENVFWSVGSREINGRRTTCYKCHFCAEEFQGAEALLEHFVLEHEMDLMVF